MTLTVRVRPGNRVGGSALVPADKSIAHRWLMLAAAAAGQSRLRGLPPSLDVMRTANAVLRLSASPQRGLETWLAEAQVEVDEGLGRGVSRGDEVMVEGDGRLGFRRPEGSIDCGNSGTTMRLLAGLVAPCPFDVALTGDTSLLRRPMERVAEPLRAMGATVSTEDGHPPIKVVGGALRGIRYRPAVPSAQVKTAVLMAGLAAEGETTVVERVATRDHMERTLEALGAPVRTGDGAVSISAFQHEGFSGTVPGDPSAAAFLAAAASISGGTLTIASVGLNPSRTRFLDVLMRMGADVATKTMSRSLGEPVGDMRVAAAGLRGTVVSPDELPLVIDDVPPLAMVAAFASGATRFEGAGELRVKESDRLNGLAKGIGELGGRARVEGEALVVDGGGLEGGRTHARGDHRLAMAFAVGALAARGESEIGGMEWAAVSFPGFGAALERLGGDLQVMTS